MATIVILGAGIGGMSQAYELKAQLGKGHRIVVVNDTNRFEFTPSNPWVAVGWRTPQQITVDLPPLLAKHGIEFIGQAAARVLPDENEVELADGECIPYDYLVIATGPQLAFDEVAGLGPKGFTESI
ncbi:MAG: NAD(P)/FAD-dependent oxidoreductase, partial [Gammaproteobacteria bacterium]